jgi:hypothetical protein
LASPAAQQEPTMPSHHFDTDAEIERLGRGLLDRSLPKRDWTHAGHFAAALWLLRHRRDLDLKLALPGLIRRYNEATGVANTDTGGYHETITQASLRAARSVLDKHADNVPLHHVVNDLLSCELGRSDWLLRYWSAPLLLSTRARRSWLEPDLQALPF